MLKHKSKKTKKKSKQPRVNQWLLIIGGAFIFLAAWAALDIYLDKSQMQSGTLADNSASQQNVYKDLNLATARQARYFNNPITVARDLGVANQTKHRLIRF